MAKPKSYSVAPGDRARQSILSKGALAGVVAVALVGLVLVFPKADLLSRLKTDNDASDRELTITYLRNLIRTETKDAQLRLLLVKKLIDMAELGEAGTVLQSAKPLLTSDEAQTQWQALDTELAWARFRSARAGTDAALQARARAELVTRLSQQVGTAPSSARIFALLVQTRDVQAPDLSRALLQKLLTQKSASLTDLLRGGQEALGAGEFELSAQLYFAAKGRTADATARRSAVMAGVKALLAGGQPLAAYQAALREQDLPPAGDLFHWTLVDLALGAGRPREAAGHLRAVVPPAWDSASLARQLDAAQLKKALDVALAGADLPQALKLVAAALLQNPTPGPAREALSQQYAQIAEWAGQPAQALQAWLALMQQGAGERAIANVMRLSPMLYDDDALLAAWLATQNRRALSFEELRRVVDIYERLGQPEGALKFLAAAGDSPAVVSLRAFLLERSGQSAQAIAVLEGLRQAQGQLTRADALRLTYLHLQSGRQAQALQALQAYAAPRTASAGQAFDLQYWDLLADLAFETGQPQAMAVALRHLLDASDSAPAALLAGPATGVLLRNYQLDRLLRHYLDAGQASETMVLAARIYPRLRSVSSAAPSTDEAGAGGKDEVALAWLDALTVSPSRAELALWQRTLSPPHLARLLKQPDTLSRRAGIYAAIGDKALASADYRASLALRPSPAVRVSYWWLLIDMADHATLRRELAAGGAALRQDAQYLEVQGAAWQVLGEPRRALGFYRQQAKTKASDYLWLANYSDILEQAGEAPLALRVRRHAFGLLTQVLARMDGTRKAEAAQALLVRVRLSESFSGGVEKQRLQRLLGQVVLGQGLPADLKKQADDLIVSWAVGGGREEAARRWLWQQQAARVVGTGTAQGGAADYAQLSLALAESDVQALDRLMEKSASKFAAIDQLNALRQLSGVQPQRLAQAASLGVELAQKEPESPRNDELQEALQADLLKLASRASVQLISRNLDVLQQSGVRVNADLAITPRLRLTAALTRMNQSSRDPLVIAQVPGRDSEWALGVRWRVTGGEASAALTQRSGLGDVAGIVLKLARQLTQRLGVELAVQKNQRTEDSVALAVAGVQDRLSGGLSYKLSREVTLSGQAALARYRTQTGSYLGGSASASLGAQYFLRQSDPDWSVRASVRRVVNRADGQGDAATALLVPGHTIPPASFFIAPSANAVGISLAYGMAQALDNPNAYSQALRPYGELGWERRTSTDAAGPVAQSAPLLRLGVRGSVLGRDQIAAGIEVRPTSGGATSREARIQYQWFGDR